MFFSQLVLQKRGHLGKIWLAGHWDRKITKNAIFKTNIPRSIHKILNPHLPMALRMTSHLLLGLVRIFSKKVKYLFDDCNQAAAKIRTLTATTTPKSSINIEQKKEEEDALLISHPKQSTIAQQIDEYLRSITKIDDLVVDKFYESKKFQDLNQLEKDKALSIVTDNYTIEIRQPTPLKTKKGEVITTPKRDITLIEEESIEEERKRKREEGEEEEEEGREPQIQYDSDTERDRRADHEIIEQIERISRTPQETEFSNWMKDFHPEEVLMRGAARPAVSVTPSTKKKKPTTPAGQESPFSPIGPFDITGAIEKPSSPTPSEASYDFNLNRGEIEGTAAPDIFDDLFQKFEETDKDILTTGADLEKPIEFDTEIGGYQPPPSPPIEVPYSPIQEGGDISQPPPLTPADIEVPPQTPVGEKKPQDIPPIVIPLDLLMESHRPTPPERRQARQETTIRIHRRRPQDLIATRPKLTNQPKTFKEKIEQSKGPKHELLTPIRHVMSTRIQSYVREVLHSKFPVVLVDDEIKLMQYLKASKIQQVLTNYRNRGTNFTDDKVREDLGLPFYRDWNTYFDNFDLKQFAILSKVQSRIENEMDVSPTKRRTLEKPQNYDKKDEEELLDDIFDIVSGLELKTPAKDISSPWVSSPLEQPGIEILPGHEELFKEQEEQVKYVEPPFDTFEHGGASPPQYPPVEEEEQQPEFKTPKSVASWHERTARFHELLQSYYQRQDTDTVSFQTIIAGKKKKRKIISSGFYEILLLKSKGLIEIEQPNSYGDLSIKKTKAFNNTQDYTKEREDDINSPYVHRTTSTKLH